MNPVDRFKDAFAAFDPARPFPVDEVYTADLVFQDPAHRIEGREALTAYFARLNRNLRSATFDFHGDLRGEGEAALSWTMTLRLKVGPAKPIVVPGMTWLRHDEQRIQEQIDRFDLGAMLYEQVPLLGSLVRLVRRAL